MSSLKLVALLLVACGSVAEAFIRYTKLQSVHYTGNVDPGEPLYLTEYIKQGRLDDGYTDKMINALFMIHFIYLYMLCSLSSYVESSERNRKLHESFWLVRNFPQ